MDRRRSARRLHPIVFVLALSVVLNLTAVWWGLPNTWSWAPDEIRPGDVEQGIDVRFAGGWFSKYPPFHYYLLTVLYAPVRTAQKMGWIDTRTPRGYTLLLIIARFLSVFMAAGLVYLVYACGREIGGRGAGTFAALISALLVPFPYYAKTANVEVPYLFWFVWSLYFFVRLLKTEQSRYYAFFAVTAALSICTKDQAAGLYVLPGLYLLWTDIGKLKRGRRDSNRTDLWKKMARRYAGALAIAAAVFAAGHNLLFNFRGFVDHVKFILGPGSEGYQMVAPSAAGHLQLLALVAKQIRFCLGWPLFFICIAGLVAVLIRKPRPRPLLVLGLFGLSYYLFFILPVRYSYDRFTLPLCIVLAVYGGKVLSNVLVQKASAVRVAAVVLIFAYSFVSAADIDRLMLKDSRYAVEKWMGLNIPEDAFILAATPGEYLPRFDAHRPVFIEDPSLADLGRETKPEYVIFSALFRRNYEAANPGNRFFSKFPEVPPGYRLVFQCQTRQLPAVLDFRGIATNLAAIDPEILIFQRKDLPPPRQERK